MECGTGRQGRSSRPAMHGRKAYGLVRSDTVRWGVFGCGTARCGQLWRGLVRCGLVRQGRDEVLSGEEFFFSRQRYFEFRSNHSEFDQAVIDRAARSGREGGER